MALLPQGELTTIDRIVDAYGLSRNHLVKIIVKLGKAGLVETVRGKNGGIRLGKPAGDILLGDIMRALEPMQVVNCQVSYCHITPACTLKNIFVDATRAFVAELDKYHLSDLVVNRRQLEPLLGLK